MAEQRDVNETVDLMKGAVQSEDKSILIKYIKKLPSRMDNHLYGILNQRTNISPDTMLDVALKKGNLELASIVKGAGCRESDLPIDMLSNEHPFMRAFYQKNIPMLQFMATSIPGMINARSALNENSTRTVLQLTIAQDSVDLVMLEAILQCGPDLEIADAEGNTALVIAARKVAESSHKDMKIVHLLMRAGSCVLSGDGGYSALLVLPDIYCCYVKVNVN